MTTALLPALYLAALMAVGLAHRRRASEGAAAFFLAGRSVAAPMLSLSLLATTLGAFGVLGVSGIASSQGLSAGWYLWGGALVLIVLGAWGWPRIDAEGAYSLPEVLGRAFGGPTRRASALLVSVAWMSIIGAQMIAAGRLAVFLAESAGFALPPAAAVIAIGALFTAYTAVGGQHSVVRTDGLQAVLVGVGLVVLAVAAWQAGLRPAPGAMNPVAGEGFGAGELAMVLLVFGAPFLVGPDIYSRVLSGSSTAAKRRAMLAAGAAMIPMVLVIAWLGAAGAGRAEAADLVLPTLAADLLHPLLAGLLLAALLAAVMSSADTCLVTVATLATRDLLGRRGDGGRADVVLARWIIVGAGGGAMALALWHDGIVEALMAAYRIYTPALLGPFVALLLAPKARFPAWTGPASLVLGGGCAVAGMMAGGRGVLPSGEAFAVAAYLLGAVPPILALALAKRRA